MRMNRTRAAGALVGGATGVIIDAMSGGEASDIPEASVVIPTFNRRAVLERCLTTLARQTHTNFEVIIVDDGSTDETVAMLERLRAAYPALRLRWFVNETNRGANASRNRGTEAARGAFIAFLDSDCVAEPDWLERLLEGFAHDRVAAVTGLVLDLKPTNVYEMAFKGTNRVHGRGAASRLVGGNMAVRRELLMRINWDEDRRFQAMERAGVPDVTNSGGCDEEGIFRILKWAGFEQRVVPAARVLHEHTYDRRSFYRQAYYGGGSAAHFVWKYRLWHRMDIVPLVVAYPLLLGAVAVPRLTWGGGAILAVWLAAVVYNEVARKGKTLGETVRSLPWVVAYYHVRALAYLRETVRLWTGRRHIARVSRADAVRQLNEERPLHG